MPKFFTFLNRAKLDDLLLSLGELSRNMFLNNKPIIFIPFERKLGVFNQRINNPIPAFSLTDISYQAILTTNDHRNTIFNDEKIIELCNYYSVYNDEVAREITENLNEDDFMLTFIFGFPQKQFWYQDRSIITEQITRNIELLEIIPKQVNSTINPDEILMNVLGLTIKQFNRLILAVFALGCSNADITQRNIDSSVSAIDPCITEENINKIIDFYSASYEEYRESELKENHLFLKPIVRTKAGRKIILNQYLLAKKIADGAFWIIRDYFWKQKRNNFTIEFGMYFEKYLENLLGFYLPKDKFEKIKCDNKNKLSDWIIDTAKYILIIEQKSSVASLNIKTLYPDSDSVRQYLEKFEEAFIQLDSTQELYKEKFAGKEIVKLVVHYEKLFIQAKLRSEIIKSCGKALKNLDNFFLIDISEFEVLIDILSKDEELFNKVIDEKMKLEQSNTYEESREFKSIFSKFGVLENEYVNKVLNHFNNLLK